MDTDNITTVNELKFSQSNKIVHQIPITQPTVNNTSKVIYIEDALNNTSKKEYTYVTKILTDTGYNYYGVKRLPFFISDYDEDYRTKEKNNINAQVVVLHPSSKQTQIYSFKNGAQYMELSKYALELANNNDKILPHYIHSYEYIIDGEIPEESNSYNLKFCGGIAHISNASSLSQLCTVEELSKLLSSTMGQDDENMKINLLDELLSYSFSLPYTYSKRETNNSTHTSNLTKVKKSSNISRIDKNIVSASENSNISECVFSQISSDNKDLLKSYTDVFSFFNKQISYVKLDNKLVTLGDISKNLEHSDAYDEYDGQNSFYTFDTISSTYNKITNSSEFKNSKDIYAKCISYVKVASNLEFTTSKLSQSQSTSNTNEFLPSYLQEYKYTAIDKNKPSQKSLYYIKKPISQTLNAYYPIQAGIVSDGSIDYYGMTYVELSNDRLQSCIDSGTGPKIYIKQDYTLKNPNEPLTDYDLDNLYTYEGNSIIYEESVGNTDYIFDLDISGNTIYAKTKDLEQLSRNDESSANLLMSSNANVSTKKNDITPISKTEIESIYFTETNSTENWAAQDRKKENVTNKLYKYSLPANYEIGSKLDYNGKWKKIDINYLKEVLKTEEDINEFLNGFMNSNRLFVKKEGYNEVAITDIVIGYDVKFYTFEIGKVNPFDVTFTNDDKYYMDVTKFVNDDCDTDTPVFSNESIILKEINKYGFINEFEYYTREPVTTISKDMYFFVDKDYYAETYDYDSEDWSDSSSSLSSSFENVHVYDGTTPIIPIALVKFGDYNLINEQSDNISLHRQIRVRNDVASMLIDSNKYNMLAYKDSENSELYAVNLQHEISYSSTYYLSCYLNTNGASISNDLSIYGLYENTECSYNLDWNSIRYFKDSVSHYSLSNEFNDVKNVLDYEKKYLYSKYFYPDFTVNNGIHQAKDGSYYTSISVFDGSRGTISKSLFLQPNVFNITEYTYEYVAHAFIEVDQDANLTDVTENHYGDYYISINDEIQQLTPESESPTYWQNYFANSSGNNKLYTYKDKKITVKYDGQSIGPRDNVQIQYFDNSTYEPKIINKDNILFGIVFNTDLTITDDDEKIVDPITNLFISPISNISQNASYEYTVVNLKEEIIDIGRNRSDTTIEWQQSDTYLKDISIQEPFYLANEKTIEFTGTYHWNLPEHKYVFEQNENNEYVPHSIMAHTGYWERDYAINTIPLAIASYNFYLDPSEISNTTASYNFIPDSKIVTAVINHPDISYKYVVRESKEIERFTYFYDGKEYNYPSTSKIQVNNDGTYTGAVKIDNHSILVQLNRHIVVDTSPVVKTITHQKAHTTYEYSSYKTSIALTNEKKPVLYNTELVPASSHKVLYWNEDAESYAIRTVVDSFAYYAYNYWYETVPFVTDTYINQNKDFKVAYIEDLKNSMNNVAYSIDNAINGASGSLSSALSSIDNVATYLNEIKNTQTNVLPSLGNTIENAVNTLSENLTTFAQNIMNQSTNTSGSEINTYDIESNIAYQTSTIDRHSTYLETNIKELKQSISSSIENSTSNIVDSISQLFTDNNQSITYIINEALNRNSKPSYEEFMLELSRELYSKCDFDEDIIETEQKDENGNIISKTKHKPNPINLAKKSIYRADILWQELKKKNIV